MHSQKHQVSLLLKICSEQLLLGFKTHILHSETILSLGDTIILPIPVVPSARNMTRIFSLYSKVYGSTGYLSFAMLKPVNAAARKERPAALPCGKAAKISTNTADLNAIESFMLFTLSKIARARSRSSIFVIPFPSTSQSPPCPIFHKLAFPLSRSPYPREMNGKILTLTK